MKSRRRTGLAALLLIVTLLASCTFGPDERDKADDEPTTGKPYTMTTVGSIMPDIEFKNGETLEDNVHLSWAEQRLGIQIRYLWTVPSTLFDTKMKLELAAKRPMPDVVATRSNAIQDLIDSGHFREVGSLFDKYASATWKRAMDEHPHLWNAYIRDGKRYAIPILDYEYHSDPVLWIRTDWLDRLDLKVPRTIAELENVMRAFTFRDPDGNGIRDTTGLALALKQGVSTRIGDATWIFGAYGTVPEQWYAGEDGALAYGSIHPGAKQALAAIQSWMCEGLIDFEAELMDDMAAVDSFVRGEAGIIAGPHWMAYWPLNTLPQAGGRSVAKAIPIPAGPEGAAARRGSLPRNGAILLNKEMEQPELFFKYQNYLFDHYAMRQGEFTYGLAENYDWTSIDGQPTTDPTRIPGGYVRVANYTLTFDGARIPSMWRDEGQPNAVDTLLSQASASWVDAYLGAPTPTHREAGDLLRKLETETFNQIIYGEQPVEAFDDFVERWHALGGEAITAEVNEGNVHP